MLTRKFRYQLSLALDQSFTLYPPAPTKFTSFKDVVDRLLPYHIWQIHDEELACFNRGEKRERAREDWGMFCLFIISFGTCRVS